MPTAFMGGMHLFLGEEISESLMEVLFHIQMEVLF